MTGDVVTAESWFESSRAVEKFDDETFVGTAPVVRIERRRKLALLKIIATSVVFVVIGVVIGAYIAFRSDPAGARRKPKPPHIVVQSVAHAAPVAPAKTAIVASRYFRPGRLHHGSASTPTVATTDSPAPAPVHTDAADVRIDSTPPGATVMLVDGGKTSFLGTTPIATSLDSSRGYDVVFTLEGRPTKTAHLDPAGSHLEIAFDKPAAAPAAAPAPADRAVSRAPGEARASVVYFVAIDRICAGSRITRQTCRFASRPSARSRIQDSRRALAATAR